MDLSLYHKNALVCGGSKGIGFAAACELAKMGANVTLVARNEEKLKDAVDKLEKTNDQKHQYIVADFSNSAKLQETITDLTSQNSYHILINNTGGPPGGPITKANPAEFVRAFEMHLLCNHILTQAVLPGMKSDNYGRIINVISTSVKQPLNGLGVSNTIRGSVANWAKTMANEVGAFGITVNNVLPGATETGRLVEIIDNKAKKLNKNSDEVKESMQSIVPMRRFAKPSEVANAIAFLASPAASYINGINLPVDGGRTKSL